jgi:hypothetical protein
LISELSLFWMKIEYDYTLLEKKVFCYCRKP